MANYHRIDLHDHKVYLPPPKTTSTLPTRSISILRTINSDQVFTRVMSISCRQAALEMHLISAEACRRPVLLTLAMKAKSQANALRLKHFMSLTSNKQPVLRSSNSGMPPSKAMLLASKLAQPPSVIIQHMTCMQRAPETSK